MITVSGDKAAFDLAKAILNMTEGGWEPNIRQSHELVSVVVMALKKIDTTEAEK